LLARKMSRTHYTNRAQGNHETYNKARRDMQPTLMTATQIQGVPICALLRNHNEIMHNRTKVVIYTYLLPIGTS
jgi:prophage DNA circulation protein